VWFRTSGAITGCMNAWTHEREQGMGVGGEGVVRNVWSDHWLHERIETPYGTYKKHAKSMLFKDFQFCIGARATEATSSLKAAERQ
jgi:hypothetical protein